jgi:DNA-binding NtrC family response regulator
MIKLKVLMIDDEVDYCKIMENFFLKKNYEVKLAYNLHDGLHALTEFMPDILILDDNLPDGKGWENVDSIVENNPRLKIFLISAYYNKERVLEFNSTNIVALEKPLSIALLNQYF